MSKKRKTSALSAAKETILETQGLHSVSDDSKRHIFNAACRALSMPDHQVKATSWKRLVSEGTPDLFFSCLCAIHQRPAGVFLSL